MWVPGFTEYAASAAISVGASDAIGESESPPPHAVSDTSEITATRANVGNCERTRIFMEDLDVKGETSRL